MYVFLLSSALPFLQQQKPNLFYPMPMHMRLQIASVDETQYLRELSYLTELDLGENPVQEVLDYRLALIFRLQRLLILDAGGIGAEEKVTHARWRCSFVLIGCAARLLRLFGADFV